MYLADSLIYGIKKNTFYWIPDSKSVLSAPQGLIIDCVNFLVPGSLCGHLDFMYLISCTILTILATALLPDHVTSPVDGALYQNLVFLLLLFLVSIVHIHK